MRTRFQIITVISLTLYLVTILFTNISLTGFWTDIIFSVAFSVFALIIVFKKNLSALWLTWTLRALAILCNIVVFGLIILNCTNPFIADTLKLRSFYLQEVDGRLFNAYFKPVGAYSGGYGNFWITESPKYFPIIEWRVYYDRTVHYDFNDDNWDGQPTDNYQVVRNYIRDEVIDKKK